MDSFDPYIEALIFTTDEPVSAAQILDTLRAVADHPLDKSLVEEAVQRLMMKYESLDYAFHIVHIQNGYMFMTKANYHHVIEVLLKQENQKKLSRAALETLAIIAYKQPVTKPEVEHIRGVNCDYTIHKLLEKDLISISGRSDGPGKPLLYTTSTKFMHHFGLADVSELPQLKDLQPAGNEIGEPVPIELNGVKDEESE